VRAGAAHRDAGVGRGLDVDRGVARAGGDEQPEVRQPLEHLPREGGALPHGDDDVEGREPGDECVLVGDVVAELDDFRRLGQERPVGAGGRDGLVVVEHGDAQHLPGLLQVLRQDGAPPPLRRAAGG
jgi:hypothetical protein